MSRFNDLRNKNNVTYEHLRVDFNTLGKQAEEARRVEKVANNAHIIIEDIDKQFKQATTFNSFDVKFLFVATALQCVRWIMNQNQLESLDPESRVSDTEGDDLVQSDKDKYTDKVKDKEGYRDYIDIIQGGVPYDITAGSKNLNLGIGGIKHRYTTLGHDPLLGWIFGTINIMTNSITLFDTRSYFIKPVLSLMGRSVPTIVEPQVDIINLVALSIDNIKIDNKRLAASVIRQGLHIKSDKNTNIGLPPPIISSISPEVAKKIMDNGFDYASIQQMVGKIGENVGYAILINQIIAVVHKLYYDESQYPNYSMYEAKTRKILSYSNAIASSSNILYVALRTIMTEDSTAWKSLDIGGFVVTIYRLVSDYNFIATIKREFLEMEFYKIVMEGK